LTRAISLLLAIIAAAPVAAQSPAASVQAAAADLPRVRADRQPYTRYLSLYHVTDKKTLDQWDAVLRFWVNSLSREAEIVAPVRVAANLWRVDLGDYTWRVETWERLAEVEPYYSVKIITFAEAKPARQVKEYWKGGINPADGKYYAPGDYMASYPAVEGKRVVKAAAGPWIPAQAFATLATATRSQIPIVRADWWLAEVTRGNDRGTGYYDWLGLGKKEADFLALGGVDVVKARALRKETGALVSRSTVTLNNRGLERYQAITGAYWKSRDYVRNTDTKNALRLLDGDIEEDANEEYVTLPNGLFAFWLQDGKGNRADTAPDTIASDGKAPGTDRRVHVGISCVRCHEEGIRPINDWARKVYQPPFTLEDKLYEEQKRKRAKYLSDLTEVVSDDQQRYAKALKRTNGLTPAANAKAIAAAWEWYAERERSLADVAGELGTDDKTLLAALKAEAKRVQLDPILAGLVQGLDVRHEHVEELVPLLHEIIGRHK